MKKQLYFLFFIASIFSASIAKGQTYGNEWINYSETNYKFPVWNAKFYKISQQTLIDAGLGSVAASDLKLLREGVEVPMYTTTNSTLGVGDYLEFYGKPADGNLDATLHLPNTQTNPNKNLISDTAYYYLKVTNGVTNSRYTVGNNTILNPPAKELYTWDSIEVFNTRRIFTNGKDIDATLKDVFYSSRFDDGEGYLLAFPLQNTTAKPTNADSIVLTLASPYKLAGAPDIRTFSRFSGQSDQSHLQSIFINNNFYLDSAYNGYKNKTFTINNTPISQIPANNKLSYKWLVHGPVNAFSSDKIGIHYLSVYYPRTFAYNSLTSNYFEMDAKPSGCYLEFTNFVHNTVPPTLYDLTNNIVYTGVLSANTANAIVKFQLPATTTTTSYYLVNQTPAVKVNVAKLKPITYTNYLNNQADYVILAPDLYINGGNALNNYKAYRESIAGGSHKVSVISFEQLYEQYAYGMNYHASSVQNFLRQIKNTWTTTPAKYIYLVGKGLEYDRCNKFDTTLISIPSYYPFKTITPTFGTPGSDNLLMDLNKDNVPDFAVGRFSAHNENEIQQYLDKVKIFEADQKNTSNQTADAASWKKRVLHLVAGGSQQNTIRSYMIDGENILEDTTLGAEVITSEKASTDVIDVAESKYLDSLVNSGLSLIHFFGHSSSLDFEYGLKNLDDYLPTSKYYLLIASGCDANNTFFDFSEKSISEKFVNHPDRGSIAVIGSDNNGYPNELHRYNDTLYKYFRNNDANLTLSEQIKGTITKIAPGISNMGRCHIEQIQLTGDPVLRYTSYALPDFNVNDKYVSTIPQQVSTSNDSFEVVCKVQNLGRYTKKDTVVLQVKRTLSNNSVQTQKHIFPKGFAFDETIKFKFAVDKIYSKGLNTIEVFIESENKITEITEVNNKITKQFVIIDEEIVAAFPYNYSIVHGNLNLVGNTINPFSTAKQYVFEMDTTALFNSPKLESTKIVSIGGVIEWKPTQTLVDSVVYYWRCAKDTLYGNSQRQWSQHSFIYLPNSSDGWNQSHYFQYTDNTFKVLNVDANRNFEFEKVENNYIFNNATIGNPIPYNYLVQEHALNLNGNEVFSQGSAYNVLQFVLIDTLSMEPVLNVPDMANPGFGKWGSKYSTSHGLSKCYEFFYNTAAQRLAVMNFMDSIPNGYIVGVMPLQSANNTKWANVYAADTALYGSGNSLFHKFRNLGFTQIDSFLSARPWVFTYQKGIPNKYVNQIIAPSNNPKITLNLNLIGTNPGGNMYTSNIGPASKWESIKRLGYARDTFNSNETNVIVYGIDSADNKVELFTLAGLDTNISFIDAAQYPNLRLTYYSEDSVRRTAEQLHYLRVLYNPLPDVAIAPNVNYVIDTANGEGALIPLEFAVKNNSNINIDSFDVAIEILDAQNQKVKQQSQKLKALGAYESAIAKFKMDSKDLVGKNFVFIKVNKQRLPLESTYANNQGAVPFKISADETNPLLDVTFDGIHIINEAIVSARPLIKIKLKDDSKFLRLDDSSLIEVRLTKPGNTSPPVLIPYHKDTLKFFPATQNSGQENVAYLEYRPALLVNDSIYTLDVKAKDKRGNLSGANSYKITFKVDNRQAITSLLNYPNPFTSSTRFVFTLTGSEVPDYMKIQILSATGKVVREITKDELGPLHIGNNITEYAWDGTDQLGDKLGNGVYFYRFVTSNNGAKIAKRELRNSNATEGPKDPIKNGMGKMVIMR